jgi:hypothetical protein
VNLLRWPDLSSRHAQVVGVRCVAGVTFIAAGVVIRLAWLAFEPADRRAGGINLTWLGAFAVACLVAAHGWWHYRRRGA